MNSGIHLNTEIAMTELNTNYENNIATLPPFIAPPVKVTAGEADDNNDSDQYAEQMSSQTVGSTKDNDGVQIIYSMNNEDDREVIGNAGTKGNTLDHNTIHMDDDENIINVVNTTNVANEPGGVHTVIVYNETKGKMIDHNTASHMNKDDDIINAVNATSV